MADRQVCGDLGALVSIGKMSHDITGVPRQRVLETGGRGSDLTPAPRHVHWSAEGDNFHADADHMSLLWEPHHHGDNPCPRHPHLAAMQWPLYIWVSSGDWGPGREGVGLRCSWRQLE